MKHLDGVRRVLSLACRPWHRGATCPLNDSCAVLDHLMAALSTAGDRDGLDMALDLRVDLTQGAEPEHVLRQFFRLRAHVEEQHYLACYRLRRSLETGFRAHVQLSPDAPPHLLPVRLDAPTLGALREDCVMVLSGDELPPPGARVQFIAVARPMPLAP